MGVVEKGNTIYIPASELTATEITVNWQQSLGERSEQYYSVPFYNKSQGDEQSLLFIQKSRVDQFKNKSSGENYTVVVDDSFQYGQDKAKTKRWLAYHDKSFNMFQWRFVSSAVSKIGSNAANFAGGLLKQYIGVNPSALQGFLGDPLRNF